MQTFKLNDIQTCLFLKYKNKLRIRVYCVVLLITYTYTNHLVRIWLKTAGGNL